MSSLALIVACAIVAAAWAEVVSTTARGTLVKCFPESAILYFSPADNPNELQLIPNKLTALYYSQLGVDHAVKDCSNTHLGSTVLIPGQHVSCLQNPEVDYVFHNDMLIDKSTIRKIKSIKMKQRKYKKANLRKSKKSDEVDYQQEDVSEDKIHNWKMEKSVKKIRTDASHSVDRVRFLSKILSRLSPEQRRSLISVPMEKRSAVKQKIAKAVSTSQISMDCSDLSVLSLTKRESDMTTEGFFDDWIGKIGGGGKNDDDFFHLFDDDDSTDDSTDVSTDDDFFSLFGDDDDSSNNIGGDDDSAGTDDVPSSTNDDTTYDITDDTINLGDFDDIIHLGGDDDMFNFGGDDDFFHFGNDDIISGDDDFFHFLFDDDSSPNDSTNDDWFGQFFGGNGEETGEDDDWFGWLMDEIKKNSTIVHGDDDFFGMGFGGNEFVQGLAFGIVSENPLPKFNVSKLIFEQVMQSILQNITTSICPICSEFFGDSSLMIGGFDMLSKLASTNITTNKNSTVTIEAIGYTISFTLRVPTILSDSSSIAELINSAITSSIIQGDFLSTLTNVLTSQTSSANSEYANMKMVKTYSASPYAMVSHAVDAPIESVPTLPPTAIPTVFPVAMPVSAPILSPIMSPILSPILSPIMSPVMSPIMSPVMSPVSAPTSSPVKKPTLTPTVKPTRTPTKTPNAPIAPTITPTITPDAPTVPGVPTIAPSATPTLAFTTTISFDLQLVLGNLNAAALSLDSDAKQALIETVCYAYGNIDLKDSVSISSIQDALSTSSFRGRLGLGLVATGGSSSGALVTLANQISVEAMGYSDVTSAFQTLSTNLATSVSSGAFVNHLATVATSTATLGNATVSVKAVSNPTVDIHYNAPAMSPTPLPESSSAKRAVSGLSGSEAIGLKLVLPIGGGLLIVSGIGYYLYGKPWNSGVNLENNNNNAESVSVEKAVPCEHFDEPMTK